MKTHMAEDLSQHLSKREQEAYVLGERSAEAARHLAACAPCRAGVARMEHGIAMFRGSAMEWSADCLAGRLQRPREAAPNRAMMPALRWALAAVLLLLAILPSYVWRARSVKQTARMSDEALLQQIDEQLSEGVPGPMESLTHLVASEKNGAAVKTTPSAGRKHHARNR